MSSELEDLKDTLRRLVTEIENAIEEGTPYALWNMADQNDHVLSYVREMAGDMDE